MILHGKDVIIKANGTAIAAAKSCELNVSVDVIKTSSPSDGQWETGIAGHKSWRASCNHLVTCLLNPVAMIGNTVTLTIHLSTNNALPITNIVSGVTFQEETTTFASGVVWDSQEKKFLAWRLDSYHNRIYYDSWVTEDWHSSDEYNTPGMLYDLYGDIYSINNSGNLVQEVLTGTAIVKDWKITATLGNLAQGSFQFQGVGELAVPTT